MIGVMSETRTLTLYWSQEMDKPKLLIVDDDESILLSMKWAFAQDYEVFLASGRQDALEIFRREHPPLVTLDLGLPPDPQGVEEGFLALTSLVEEDPYVKVIIVSGQGDRQNALTAIGQGAYDFFCKPIQVEEVSVILRRALRLHQLESEYRLLQAAQVKDSFDELLGTSPQMQQVFSTIEKVAATEASDSDMRRKRHREGTGCKGAPWKKPEEGRGFRSNQLRRHSRESTRKRVVRAREGGVHGCSRPKKRPHRNGRPWHAVFGRNRRPASGASGQASAFSPGTHDRARRWQKANRH